MPLDLSALMDRIDAEPQIIQLNIRRKFLEEIY